MEIFNNTTSVVKDDLTNMIRPGIFDEAHHIGTKNKECADYDGE